MVLSSSSLRTTSYFSLFDIMLIIPTEQVFSQSGRHSLYGSQSQSNYECHFQRARRRILHRTFSILFYFSCTDTAVIPRSLLVAQCAVLQTSPMMDHRCCMSSPILPRTPIDCLFHKQQYDFWTPFQKRDYSRGTVCKLQVIAAWCPRSGTLIAQPNRTRLSD